MGKINLLDDSSIGKIAAGEVVERPASVVKELMENSIDAGADSIDLQVTGAGSTLIRVADNGEGMTAEDAEKACLRHATSKIKSAEDIFRIKTLGFRGEGLSSIAAVSQIDLITCVESDAGGAYLYLEGGKVLRKRPSGRSCGTTIEVRNLFFNVPARRKFLRKDVTELSAISDVINRFVLSHPDIEFKFTHGERVLLHATKDLSLPERVNLVLGQDAGGGMVSVEGRSEGLSVQGYVSPPSLTRKDRRHQMFFVNGRYVKSKVISDGLYDGYRSMLERGRHPAAVLFFNVPAGDVDVNVHPTKQIIKFGDEKEVRGFISANIKNTFSLLSGRESGAGVAADSCFFSPEQEGGFSTERQVEFAAGTFEKNVLLDKEAPDKSGISLAKSEELRASGTDLFQVGSCFIVRPGRDKVSIIDQHAAHERILFEMFSKACHENPGETQNLLFPVRIELSSSEAILMENLLLEFERLGFSIENFGERTYVVQSVPAALKDIGIKEMIHDILSEMEGIGLKRADIMDEIIKLASCKAAIKAGEALSAGEMEALIDRLDECEVPFTCPHGRPTTIEISVADLEKRFRRK